MERKDFTDEEVDAIIDGLDNMEELKERFDIDHDSDEEEL